MRHHLLRKVTNLQMLLLPTFIILDFLALDHTPFFFLKMRNLANYGNVKSPSLQKDQTANSHISTPCRNLCDTRWHVTC